MLFIFFDYSKHGYCEQPQYPCILCHRFIGRCFHLSFPMLFCSNSRQRPQQRELTSSDLVRSPVAFGQLLAGAFRSSPRALCVNFVRPFAGLTEHDDKIAGDVDKTLRMERHQRLLFSLDPYLSDRKGADHRRVSRHDGHPSAYRLKRDGLNISGIKGSFRREDLYKKFPTHSSHTLRGHRRASPLA